MLNIKVLFMPGTSKMVEAEEGDTVKDVVTTALGAADISDGQTIDWSESTYKLNSEAVDIDTELTDEDDMGRLLVAVKIKGE